MFSSSEIDQDGLHLELVVQPAISYALVHNRVPVVRRVTLTDRSALSAYDLALELTVVGPHGAIAAPWRVERGVPVPPGRSVSWEEFGALAPDAAGLVATNEAYPVEVRLTVTRPDHPDVALAAYNLGQTLIAEQPEIALQLLERAVEIWSAAESLPTRDVGQARIALAQLALEGGRFEQAREHAQAAATVFEQVVPPEDVAHVIGQCVAGDLRYASGEVIWLQKSPA
jgi:hypothetical protein